MIEKMRRTIIAAVLIGCSSSSPSTTAPTPGSATVARVPPAVELTCASDADCTLTYDELVDAPNTHACCGGCQASSLTKVSYANFKAWCEKNPAPMCPPLGCAMPPQKAACVSGKCAVVAGG